jgi:nucleoside-diphosphate-sugar epimerase
MKALVTGASGFIGSHLAERLVKEKYNVRVLIRNEKKENSESRKDSLELLKKLKVGIVEGDLLDKESLKRAVKGIDVVFHLAAIARPMAIPDEAYFKVNEEGTRNLLEACKNKKIKKIIIMSSVSAVGSAKKDIAVNEQTECKPVDIYGWSKLAEENAAMEYFNKHKMPIIILRPPMVFGERDFEMLKLFKIVSKRFFPIRSNVKCMEFLYVGNLVEACLLAVKSRKNGEIYHISNGEHYSINEVVHAIEKAEDKKIFPIGFPKFVLVFGGYVLESLGKIFHFHPPFKHDTVNWMTEKFWYSDISKAEKELRYKPIFSLEEGVKRTANYYKEKNYL